MKTYHLKDLLKKDLLIIELPEEKTINTLMDLEITYGYTLLGKPDEISEDGAKKLVQCINVGTTNKYVASVEFFNNVNNRYYKTATESLLSAIESEIFWDVNPMSKPKKTNLNSSFFDMQVSFNDEVKFEEAELRTFDRNRTLIFVKN